MPDDIFNKSSDTPGDTVIKSAIPTPLLAQLNDYLARYIGLSFKEARWSELERGIRKATPDFEFQEPEACIRWLLASPLNKTQVEILSRHLTVGETYFFRDASSFEVLDKAILPSLIAAAETGKSRSLRIWSAACSTGEEAYSIAMILDRKKNQLKDWDITILATDINGKALEQAQSGLYSEWSFRETPAWVKDTYFTKTTHKHYQLDPQIIKMVRFEYLNLAEDTYPSLLNYTNAMDILFCRNVLMYFSAEKAKAVVERFYLSLVMGGWFLVAPTDGFHLFDIQCFHKEPQYDSIFTKCEKVAEHPPLKTEWPLLANYPPVDPVAVSPDLPIIPILPILPIIPILPILPMDIYPGVLLLYRQGNYREILSSHVKDGAPIEGDPAFATHNDKMCALVARCYANLGHLDEALLWCEKAILANKLATTGYYLKATILQEMGREEEAVRELKRCLYLDQDSILALFTLGHITLRQQNPAESNRHFSQALTLLQTMADEAVVSQEEGLTAGRMRDIIKTTMSMNKGARE